MTLPVVWIPEANEDLQEASTWYDNIRRELGERFAQAVEATVEAIAEHPFNSLSSTGAVAVQEYRVSRTGYSSRFNNIGL